MKLPRTFAIAWCFLGWVCFATWPARAQEGGGGGRFRQPAPEKQVTITAIPGVIAAGAQWKLVWQGSDNADGLVGTKDGGILFAQEQPSFVGRLDPHDKYSIFARDTHGTGGLGFDHKGRLIGVERTCSDPGGHPDECHEPAEVIVISPKREVLAKDYNGHTFTRLGEVVCDSKGGAYFKDDNAGTYFVDAKGKVSLVADSSIHTNGMMLSRDEKTLYVTDNKRLVAFDIQPDGTTTNPHEFAKLEGGGNGDGMAIDSEGRLYVTTGDPGIQVIGPDGKFLGVIPLPRSASSVAFSGPGKRIL
jgi:gluconolactonase